jgi:hypothetical protein
MSGGIKSLTNSQRKERLHVYHLLIANKTKQIKTTMTTVSMKHQDSDDKFKGNPIYGNSTIMRKYLKTPELKIHTYTTAM